MKSVDRSYCFRVCIVGRTQVRTSRDVGCSFSTLMLIGGLSTSSPSVGDFTVEVMIDIYVDVEYPVSRAQNMLFRAQERGAKLLFHRFGAAGAWISPWTDPFGHFSFWGVSVPARWGEQTPALLPMM